MAIEVKDIQDWASRTSGDSGAVDDPGIPEEGGEEIAEPVDATQALSNLSGILADALVAAQEAAQALRDAADDEQAAAVDAIVEQLSALSESAADLAPSEEEGEEEMPEDSEEGEIVDEAV